MEVGSILREVVRKLRGNSLEGELSEEMGSVSDGPGSVVNPL